MNGFEEIAKFIKKYSIGVAFEYSNDNDAYKIRFRDYESDTALDVLFNGHVFELDMDLSIKYALERAENEMIKCRKTVEELSND